MIASKNIGPFLAFTRAWFAKHQRTLLWLLNSRLTRRWFRHCMRILKDVDLPLNVDIREFAPNHFTWQIGECEYKTDFRTHNKYAKRIYFAFKPVWWVLHYWDALVADRYIPKLSFGFATLVVYPDPDVETNSVDGSVGTNTTGTWSQMTGAAGNVANDSATGTYACYFQAGSSSNQWDALYRSVTLFYTASLTAGATISEAVVRLQSSSRGNTLSSSPEVNIYATNPASNTALTGTDFATFGSTVFCDTAIGYTPWTNGAYHEFTLNASGLAAIDKIGVSKFGFRDSVYDAADSSPTWSSGLSTYMAYNTADVAGETADPRLTVTYTTGSPKSFGFIF